MEFRHTHGLGRVADCQVLDEGVQRLEDPRLQRHLIAVTDGLKGMPEALGAVFPATTLQTCIVHLVRGSLDFASWTDRKALAGAIKPIYTAVSAEAAEAALNAFEAGPWGQKLPTVVGAWRRVWDRGTPFFAFPPEVRRVIYTTNAIESVNKRAGTSPVTMPPPS